MKQFNYIYQNLLEHPRDREIMLVLADALEEEDNQILSNAYRWAAENDKWPFIRTVRSGNLGGILSVLDWESEERLARFQHLVSTYRLSLYNCLPHELWKCIKEMPTEDKIYGGLNEAFVLLGKGLEILNNKNKSSDTVY